MSSDNKNFILAIALSALLIIGWQVFYVQPEIERQRQLQEKEAAQSTQVGDGTVPQAGGTTTVPQAGGTTTVPQTGSDVTVPQAGGSTAPTAPTAAGLRPRAVVIAATPRAEIKTPSLAGSINLEGGRIDDLHLLKYKETVKPGSPTITLLSPSGTETGFFADHGWAPSQGNTAKLPTPKTVWSVAGNRTLTPDAPVTLTWDNGGGLVFKRTFSVDKDYMFGVSQEVVNNTGAPVVLYPYARVQRQQIPKIEGFIILHEGLVGVLGEDLKELDYDDVKDDPKPTVADSKGGWLGITDKYWAVVVIPSQDTEITGRFTYTPAGGRDLFQSAYTHKTGLTVAPGQTGKFDSQVFAGAKVVQTINRYAEETKITQFDLMVDWGYLYFITKPLFWLLDKLYGMFGNFGVAILIATVLIKIAFFPLANKSYASMAKMKVLQPELVKLRERFADDKQRQQKEMMELYKKEQVNPMAGCLPVLLQIPVFFALYKVLFVTIEMRHAPFYGWIKDLSANDPTSLFNLFGLIPWEPPLFLMIGVLPLIMGVTMWIQMRLNPAPPDPIQAQIFNWMPLFFTFLLASFPAGLVLYWAWNNFLSIIQQATIMKRHGADINLLQNIKDALPFLFKKTTAE
ncbi:MAG: membrane protein insertase YidC [Hyphomicrobiales bacterium]|nr:membrane protein insertase YidC [Hyphomicrobiales bacterium]